MKKELKTWEKTIKLPNGYWENEDHIREALQWLFEVKLKILTTNTIVSVKDFKDNRLYGLLNRHFDNSPYKAINYIYPGKFKPWEKCGVPRNYWKNEDHIREVLHWLFEEKLDIFNQNTFITIGDFKNNNLLGLLNNNFNGIIYKAIKFMYPGKFKPWEKCNVPKDYWSDDNHIKEALQWLFEEKLNIFEDDTTVTTKDFKKYHLLGLLVNRFKGSIYKAIDYMYPGRFKPWEKCEVPRGYWNDESNVKDALKWLFEAKLDIFNNDNMITINDFKKYNFMYMINNHFNGSTYAAINYVYPGRFKPWEKCNVPRGYWNDESNAKEALHWLVDEKGYKINISSFKKNNMYTLAKKYTISELKELYNK